MLNSSETEENQSYENENDINIDSKQIWDITEEEEKQFLDNHIINEYIYQPQTYRKCHNGKLIISVNNKNKLFNPYLLVCKNNKCKVIKNLPKYSIFALNPKYPVSVI